MAEILIRFPPSFLPFFLTSLSFLSEYTGHKYAAMCTQVTVFLQCHFPRNECTFHRGIRDKKSKEIRS